MNDEMDGGDCILMMMKHEQDEDDGFDGMMWTNRDDQDVKEWLE